MKPSCTIRVHTEETWIAQDSATNDSVRISKADLKRYLTMGDGGLLIFDQDQRVPREPNPPASKASRQRAPDVSPPCQTGQGAFTTGPILTVPFFENPSCGGVLTAPGARRADARRSLRVSNSECSS